MLMTFILAGNPLFYKSPEIIVQGGNDIQDQLNRCFDDNFCLRSFQRERVFQKRNQFLSIVYEYCMQVIRPWKNLFFQLHRYKISNRRIKRDSEQTSIDFEQFLRRKKTWECNFCFILFPSTNFWVISVYFLTLFFSDTLHIIVFILVS